jgi:spore coat polysaccharide biosynthesis protein SpsF (cytidylyltransferase family)
MKTVVICQARLGSSRLPAKVLLPLPTGRTVLEEVLHRCKQIEGVDEVVCAIPERESDWRGDDILPDFIARVPNVRIVRGAHREVIQRYVKAAAETYADVIMRITADCPLIDPTLCAEVLKARAAADADYACNNLPRTFPHGLDCECFKRWLLDDTCGFYPEDEHVTTAMRTRPNIKKAFVTQPYDRSDKRWTLDTIEDYYTIWTKMTDDLGSNSIAA